MISEIFVNKERIKVDFSKSFDLSITMRPAEDCVRAWYVDPIRIEPVMENGFVGDVNLGGAVNFKNIFFNPHGNGTHTECVGHISKEKYLIEDCLKEHFIITQVLSVHPKELAGDHIIQKSEVDGKLNPKATAIAIRTLPNLETKKTINYSSTNPTYMDIEAMKYIRDAGIDHVLIDLPSVDREEDEGKLVCHHAFWEYPENVQKHRTISELIFVPNEVKDGLYLMNLQTASFENDATPSRPILFSLID